MPNIQVSHETRELLRAKGAKGESYDEIIKRLLTGCEVRLVDDGKSSMGVTMPKVILDVR